MTFEPGTPLSVRQAEYKRLASLMGNSSGTTATSGTTVKPPMASYSTGIAPKPYKGPTNPYANMPELTPAERFRMNTAGYSRGRFYSGYNPVNYAAPTTTISPVGQPVPLPPPSPYTYEDPMALAAKINALMIDQARRAYEINQPGYTANRQQEGRVVGSQLRGEVPTDVVNQIITGAAERGILTGTTGSPNANAAYLRALGLESTAIQNKGIENMSIMTGDTPVPELFNPASLIVPERLGYLELLAYLSATQPKQVTTTGAGGTSTQFMNPSPPGFSFYGQPFKV